jgi:hypothetical protein
VPRLKICEVHPGIRLTTEEKARKTLSEGSRRMPVGKEYTEQSIHVNKTIRKQLTELNKSIQNIQPYIQRLKQPKEHHYTATLHHTSPNYTSLHLSTLHSLTITLHYPLIWINPITYLTAVFHLTSLN